MGSSPHSEDIYDLDSTEVANWVALAVFFLAFLFYGFLRWFYHYKICSTRGCKSHFYSAIYELRLLFTYIGLFALAFLIVLAGTLLMEQGTVVREEDSVEVEWARWATYVVIHALLAYALATWYWQKKPVLGSFTALGGLYSLAWLFAILSTDYRRFVWYAIGWVFFLGWLFKLIIYFRRNARIDGASFVVKLLVTITFILYPIVLLLEPSLCDVISQGAATWIYFVLDFITVVVLLFVGGLLYIPDPSNYCCTKDKCECGGKCSCHVSAQGTHVHHTCPTYVHRTSSHHHHTVQIGQEASSGYKAPNGDGVDWTL